MSLYILLFFLLVFIWYEFIQNTTEIKHHLFIIFTLYMCILIIVKILWFSYKLSFQTSEQKLINIKYLQTWDIVEKKFLIDAFWEEKILWYVDWKKKKERKNKWILYPDPKIYFKNIKNPLEKRTRKKLQEIYKFLNKELKKESKSIFYKDIKNLCLCSIYMYLIHLYILIPRYSF